MKAITKKAEIQVTVQDSLLDYQPGKVRELSERIHSELLSSKVRFPLLEYSAEILFEEILEEDQLDFLNEISAQKTIGGNVIIGILLQRRMSLDLDSAFKDAVRYISAGSEWYVSDIIGERVFGVGLLNRFDPAFPEFKKLKSHSDSWVVRAIGPGAHYATKKGLDEKSVGKLFEFLLELSFAKEPNIRSGIGWAAKTIAKFHPDIIEKHREEVFGNSTGAWFKRKVKIGLERNAYAKGG